MWGALYIVPPSTVYPLTLSVSLSRVLSKSISRRLHTALYLHGRVGADVSRLRSVRKGGDCKETLRPIGEPTVRGSYSLSEGGSGISPSARLCEVSFAVEDFFCSSGTDSLRSPRMWFILPPLTRLAHRRTHTRAHNNSPHPPTATARGQQQVRSSLYLYLSSSTCPPHTTPTRAAGRAKRRRPVLRADPNLTQQLPRLLYAV